MNLYLVISHPRTETYYSACVVCAESEEDAKTYHPEDGLRYINEQWCDPNYPAGRCRECTWTTPMYLKAELLGIADPNTKPGVVLTSVRG